MNARQARNFISKLEKENSKLIEEKEAIVREVVFLYNNLYNDNNSKHMGFEVVGWSPMLESLADWVIRPFDEVEVRREIFNGDGNKAPK